MFQYDKYNNIMLYTVMYLILVRNTKKVADNRAGSELLAGTAKQDLRIYQATSSIASCGVSDPLRGLTVGRNLAPPNTQHSLEVPPLINNNNKDLLVSQEKI